MNFKNSNMIFEQNKAIDNLKNRKPKTENQNQNQTISTIRF